MTEAQRHFLFLSSSRRKDGNTETLAREAAKALPVSVKQIWLRHADLPLPDFNDIRHAGDGVYPMPEGNGRVLLDATLAATDLVFVAPVYWYALPADAKLYLDHWSAWMRVPGIDFRPRMVGKTMWAVTMLSDLDTAQADPLLGSLRWTAKYLGMRWGGSLQGYGNKPGDIMADKSALARAAQLFAV
ncbi:flavodoxin family protein [Dongia mobilis]|jgi:multimeric flavodoxin WrbA|uniref:flavodoxin family protein n=1 Tax=Dongia sp. TaxID=1977262 RepID=UPI0026EA1EAF